MKIVKPVSVKYSERIVGLDILRATAILFVLKLHACFLIAKTIPEKFLKYDFNIDGVSIFFVLSGFLIGNIIIRIIKDNGFTIHTLINFWIRRWFRTIPNYLFVLILVVADQFYNFHNKGLFSLNYLFFLQNFSYPHPDFFQEAWSLCVEEWFYLLFPFIVYLLYKLLKNKSNSILYSTLIFLIVPLILRIIKYEMGIGIHDTDMEYRKIVIFRLDSIMYGLLAAYIYTNKNELWTKSKTVLLGLGIIFIMLIKGVSHSLSQFYYPLFFNVESITLLLLLPFFSELKTTGILLLDKLIKFISILSYSIYLLNYTIVLKILIPFTEKTFCKFGYPINKYAFMSLILYCFYTFFGAYLLYHFFEKRMTNLRDKIKLN